MTYAGHHADGSSIQNHSAGPEYPFILQLRDRDPDAAKPTYYWEVVGPGIEGALRFASYGERELAVRRLLAVRESDDAWAFELERLCMLAGQRLEPMVAAVQALAQQGPARWQDMSKVRRVGCLLALGKVRNTLKLPPGTPEANFAEYARRAGD